MQFIKMSLLSILIFFIGMSAIIFGNINNSSNYQNNLNITEHSLSSNDLEDDDDADLFSNDDATVTFGEDFFSETNGGIGTVTLTASWTYLNSFYDLAGITINMYDGDEKISIFGGQISSGDQSTPDLTFTREEDPNTIFFSGTINGDENLERIIDYNFQENHVYRFELEVWDPKGNGKQEVTFTTPSPSVINFTAGTAGKVTAEAGGRSVVVDYSWEQENQIDDSEYKIDENLQLWLSRPGSGIDDIPLDIDEHEYIVTKLTPSEEYENWALLGIYNTGKFNIDGQDTEIFQLNIESFDTSPGVEFEINEDKKFDPTYSSIFIRLDIINKKEKLAVDTKFYYSDDYNEGKGIPIDESNVEIIATQYSNDTSGQEDYIPTGWVDYEIKNLDYNTEYNLMVNINDSVVPLELPPLKTKDMYPWVTPVDIVLLVIILVEIAAVTSIYILLQRNQKK